MVARNCEFAGHGAEIIGREFKCLDILVLGVREFDPHRFSLR